MAPVLSIWSGLESFTCVPAAPSVGAKKTLFPPQTFSLSDTTVCRLLPPDESGGGGGGGCLYVTFEKASTSDWSYRCNVLGGFRPQSATSLHN